MDKKDTNIVGTRIGLYDVLYECDFKSNDGHRMFHVKCSECGWESNVQMHRIKMLSKKAMKDPCTAGNPREVTTSDIEKIYEKAY